MQNSGCVTVANKFVFGRHAIFICGNRDMTKVYSYNKLTRDNPKTANI